MDTKVILGLGVVLIGGSVIFTQGDNERSLRLSQAKQSQSSEVSQKLETEAIESQSELAESRYKSGQCLLAINPIQPNQKVQESVPTSSVICDRFGMTAITDRNGRLTGLAKTANQKIIQEGIE